MSLERTVVRKAVAAYLDDKHPQRFLASSRCQILNRAADELALNEAGYVHPLRLEAFVESVAQRWPHYERSYHTTLVSSLEVAADQKEVAA